MQGAFISKSIATTPVAPHLSDYAATVAQFSWDDVRAELEGLPDNAGLNIAHEAVDRHAAGPHRDHLALRWLGKDGAKRDFTYGDLQEWSNRFANILQQLGIQKGERVFGLAGRVPELYISVLGTLKHTSVFCPLFAAFGPEPIAQRLQRGDAAVLVTTTRLYTQKIAALRPSLPQLRHVLLIDADDDLDGLLEVSSPLLARAFRGTGRPKS